MDPDTTTGVPAPAVRPGAATRKIGGSALLRQAARQKSYIAASMLTGFAIGLGYRAMFDPVGERDVANFLRSGLHGVGVGLTVWVVTAAFSLGARSRFGVALRRQPLVVEMVVRALAMTAALVAIGLSLQFVLYADTLRLHWLPRDWLTVELPRIVLMGFGLSLVFGAFREIQRLVGSALLTSVLLGTYHRPARQQLIVMFLDLANSTRLAEEMGEIRVHDLITQFFFDIDEPIAEFGGAVHAYVGDEVIVSWPVTEDRMRNARCLACFFAIRRKIASLAPDYEAEFGVAPSFRAGIHAGAVVVSECGDAKRQIAYFGDTMNVAARLCDYCKAINQELVISGDLLRLMSIPTGASISDGALVEMRGRRERVEAHVIACRGAGT